MTGRATPVGIAWGRTAGGPPWPDFGPDRYYDPGTGQFTQQDPIGIAGGLNLYGFADGDPINFADPFGLKGCAKDLTDEEREECEKKEAEEREKRAAEWTAYLSRVHQCTQDTPGYNAMLAVSPLGIANMKLGEGFRQPGSSPFTSIDRRFPSLPGANVKGGVPVRTVGSGAVKTAGTLGTTAAVVSVFATSYVATTLVRCYVESREQ